MITTAQGNRRRDPHGDRTPIARKGASRHVFVSNLLVEIIGFLVVIARSWANEFFGLPNLIFGAWHRVN